MAAVVEAGPPQQKRSSRVGAMMPHARFSSPDSHARTHSLRFSPPPIDWLPDDPPSKPLFQVPAMALFPEEAKPRTVNKIHIIGEDPRSRLLAHVLSGVYDSVELLGWRTENPCKYSNIQKPSGDKTTIVEPNAAIPLPLRTRTKTNDAHIKHLLITGRACEMERSIRSVADKIDQNTTVCMIHEGLGVLESVRRKFLYGSSKPSPKFILGYMSHRVYFDRKTLAASRSRYGHFRVTLDLDRDEDMEPSLPMLNSLRAARDLNATLTTWDRWLLLKLPTLMFDCVVEPVCVMLGLGYDELLSNMPAQRIMHNLLAEIIRVIDNMPELDGSNSIRWFLHGSSVEKALHKAILERRSRPSKLALRIDKGLPTDTDFLNGYFIRRARELGLDVRMNHMVRNVVKAKHVMALEKLNSYVPMEETSVPSYTAGRYGS